MLVQANFSGRLTVLGQEIDPRDVLPDAEHQAAEPTGNSCMIIIATDRGFDSRQLTRIARRAIFALGRAGSDYAQGSGDYAIAFATGALPGAQDGDLGPVFSATAEATHEAILNSLFLATTTTGYQGHTRHAIPLDRLPGQSSRPAPRSS